MHEFIQAITQIESENMEAIAPHNNQRLYEILFIRKETIATN
jgi:hypothetical protein